MNKALWESQLSLNDMSLAMRKGSFTAPDEALFQQKKLNICLISTRKHMLWYSFEAPRQGASHHENLPI